jgi:hypothetical protein
MRRPKGKRQARPPVNVNVNIPSFEEAQERAILDVMRPWPRQMEAQLKAHGYENFAGGDRVLQEAFEATLKDPREPDALAAIKWLAEQGHRAAQGALRKYTRPMLEDGAANLPASVRSYLMNILDGRVAPHPPDHQNDIVRNMLRNSGIAMMVAVATARWRQLPELNSGRWHSAAWFVAAVMTEHGHKLSERQVRSIVQTYGQGVGKRLADFLLVGAVE